MDVKNGKYNLRMDSEASVSILGDSTIQPITNLDSNEGWEFKKTVVPCWRRSRMMSQMFHIFQFIQNLRVRMMHNHGIILELIGKLI